MKHRISSVRSLFFAAGLALVSGALGADVLQVFHSGDIRYVSGGIGTAEQVALREAKPHYSLHLTFAHVGGAFLARVPVTITGADGRILLEAVSRGPYLFANLPPGDYRVSAEVDGEVKTQAVTVPASGSAAKAFYWNKPG